MKKIQTKEGNKAILNQLACSMNSISNLCQFLNLVWSQDQVHYLSQPSHSQYQKVSGPSSGIYKWDIIKIKVYDQNILSKYFVMSLISRGLYGTYLPFFDLFPFFTACPSKSKALLWSPFCSSYKSNVFLIVSLSLDTFALCGLLALYVW